MQNKGAITLLAVALALVSLYQLFFTYKTNQVENAAKEFANGNPIKEKEYLDSVANQPVYNFLGLAKFTYKECKELELNLGLDLKGGMNVTMEVDVVDVVKSLANHSTDPAFNQAIEEAVKMRVSSPKDFVTLFGEAFEKIAPGAQLASPAIFGTHEMKEKIKVGATNKEVLDVIRKEADGAIDNTFNILRTRIDRFGVAQPNIRKADISGRIVIELPGIKEPQRVRELLQGTAALEFYETFDNAKGQDAGEDAFFNYLVAADQKLKEVLDTQASNVTNEETTTQVADTTKVQDKESAILDAIKGESDSLKTVTSMAEYEKEHPLLAILSPNVTQQFQPVGGSTIGYANIKDTAKINAYLRLPQVKAAFPRNARLLWEMKAVNGMVPLHAIKITTRNGKAPLEGDAVIDARQDYDQQGRPVVSMQMNGEGTKTWARLTKDNIGRCIAIVLDGMVASSPNVNDEIKGGSSQISGRFDVKEAGDLANILKSGKLPAPARIIADEVVGASLGQEAIQSGMWSFIIAFVLVLAYMLFFYSKSAGLAADVALLANLFFLFGILQGNEKTSWMRVIPVGIIYFFLYYFIFKFMIKKFDFKTPGREDDDTETKLYTKADVNARKEAQKGENTEAGADSVSEAITRGLGGKKNISDVDCCATRLRCTVKDAALVNDGVLKATGASGVVHKGQGVQVIYGPNVTVIKSNLEDYLETAPDTLETPAAESQVQEKETPKEEAGQKVVDTIVISSPISGTAADLVTAPDEAFAQKMMGDGAVVTPEDPYVYAPEDGEVAFVFDTKHAIGFITESGISLLIHVGIDTVKLNGKGFEALVESGQEVKKGDPMLKLDLDYLSQNAPSIVSPVLCTELEDNQRIHLLKEGQIKAGEPLFEIEVLQ